MPDDTLASKPPPRRWGLYSPYILVMIAFAAWSGYWLAAKEQLEGRLDQAAANLGKSGYELSWKTRQVSGFPFRLHVDLTGARLAGPRGWGLAAPALKAEANAYDLNHWMFVAADGLTVLRPEGGAVRVTGPVLRASLTHAGDAPRFAFEGQTLAFTPAPGAAPFAVSAADKLELHARRAGGDRIQLQLRLSGAQTRRTGVFAQVAPLAPLSLTLAADLSHGAALAGRDWPSAVQAWTGAGGAATVSEFALSVGDIGAAAKGGPVTVGADGRLRGALDLSLRKGPAALAALGQSKAVDPGAAQAAAAVAQARGEAAGADLQLVFEAGETTFGPVRLGPAPRVY